MSQEQIDILQRALKREKSARKAAEKILEKKAAELYKTNKKLSETNAYLEASLTKTDSQLQGVFENIVDAYIIIDIFGNILKVNDAAVELFGFSDTKESLNLIKIVDPSEYEKVKKAFQLLVSEGSITNFKVKIITQQDEVKLIQVNASVIYDNGVAVAAQGIARDITLEDKYRKSIVTEKEKYYNIISNMNLGLIELDINDKILMVNQSTVNMTGYSRDELIGVKGKDFLPIEEDRGKIEAKVKARKKGKTDSYEIRVRNKEGEVRYWLISGAPNYDINGKLSGSIGINLDITDIKNLEHQKEKLLKELEKNNDELQEYAHIVSHDLKSPLRSIYALVSWLKEDNIGKFDEVSLQNIAHIEATLEKMEQLITDILNYSSIGVAPNEKEKFSSDILIKDLIKMLYVPEHVSIQVNTNLPEIRGYKTKIQQLFQNLISNAVKFIDKGKGLVEIDVVDLNTYYKFSIKDNGMGIDKKYHDKIFKIFHSLNKSKHSTGIGLSIVKKIIDLHEGNIWLESEPNVGTTFFFTIKK